MYQKRTISDQPTYNYFPRSGIMQKDILDSNIDLMKEMMLKKLMDEKNDLIQELETENSLLKQTIIELNARLKSNHHHVSYGRDSRDNRDSKSLTPGLVEFVGYDTRNDTYERIRYESRVMTEIQNIRKEFYEVMMNANSNNAQTPNIIYAAPYGHLYPAVHHMSPHIYNPTIMNSSSQPLQPLQQQSHCYGVNPTQGIAPGSTEVYSTQYANSGGNIRNKDNVKLGDIMTNSSVPLAPPMDYDNNRDTKDTRFRYKKPAMNLLAGSNQGSQNNEKGGMDMVILELKSVLNKKELQKETMNNS